MHGAASSIPRECAREGADASPREVGQEVRFQTDAGRFGGEGLLRGRVRSCMIALAARFRVSTTPDLHPSSAFVPAHLQWHVPRIVGDAPPIRSHRHCRSPGRIQPPHLGHGRRRRSG